MSNNLFQLTPEELSLTSQLSQVIQQEITAAAGVIPFSRYMELALYYPGLGYYSNRRLKFGAEGDFITAPLVSGLFAYALSCQLKQLFSFGLAHQVLEFGAGNGRLAADLLASSVVEISHYYILELSADLVLAQRESIAQIAPQHLAKVVWLSDLPLNFNGVMLANEVLDAQPCKLIRYHQDGIYNLGVTYTTERQQFAYQEYPLDSESQLICSALGLNYSDYQSEIHPASVAFMRSLAASLGQGAILLLDYGYAEQEYYHPQKNQGTLRGFYQQHLLEDVLRYPGLIDITSSVNWSAIARSGIKHGLELIGYTSQAAFLLNCDISSELSRLQEQLSVGEYLAISNQVNKLISANEMGEVFKVMGFSKGLKQDSWLGFSHGDRSYSL